MAGRGIASGGRTAVPRLSAQRSMMVVEGNPFEKAAATASTSMDMHVEHLQDCVPISAEQYQVLKEKLQAIESNEERLKLLETEKLPYLFASQQLLHLCEITTSLKTRMSMIKSLGPRLLDPRSETTRLVGMFRFAEEKQHVEDVLRNRFHAQQNTVFVRVEQHAANNNTTDTSSPNNTAPTTPTAGAAASRRGSNPLLGGGGRGGAHGGRFHNNHIHPATTTSTIINTAANTSTSTVTADDEGEGEVGFGHDDIVGNSTPLPLSHDTDVIEEGSENEENEDI